MHDVTHILPFLGLGAVVFFAFKFALPLQRKAIKDWAASNHYQLLESEQRFLREGPFTWMRDRGSFLNKNNSVVYYVKVLTHEDTAQQGRIRYAWVRVNYPPVLWPFSDYTIDVRWDAKHDQHLL